MSRNHSLFANTRWPNELPTDGGDRGADGYVAGSRGQARGLVSPAVRAERSFGKGRLHGRSSEVVGGCAGTATSARGGLSRVEFRFISLSRTASLSLLDFHLGVCSLSLYALAAFRRTLFGLSCRPRHGKKRHPTYAPHTYIHTTTSRTNEAHLYFCPPYSTFLTLQC